MVNIRHVENEHKKWTTLHESRWFLGKPWISSRSSSRHSPIIEPPIPGRKMPRPSLKARDSICHASGCTRMWRWKSGVVDGVYCIYIYRYILCIYFVYIYIWIDSMYVPYIYIEICIMCIQDLWWIWFGFKTCERFSYFSMSIRMRFWQRFVHEWRIHVRLINIF